MIENWFRDEVERARTRIAQLPRWARPVVTRPVAAQRDLDLAEQITAAVPERIAKGQAEHGH